jgi:hypothetical protein
MVATKNPIIYSIVKYCIYCMTVLYETKIKSIQNLIEKFKWTYSGRTNKVKIIDLGRILVLFLRARWDWFRLARRPLFGLLMDDEKRGAVGGMIGKRNRSTLRKPTTVPLCPPQIPHDLTLARTRAALVGSRWLTSSAALMRNYFLNIGRC